MNYGVNMDIVFEVTIPMMSFVKLETAVQQFCEEETNLAKQVKVVSKIANANKTEIPTKSVQLTLRNLTYQDILEAIPYLQKLGDQSMIADWIKLTEAIGSQVKTMENKEKVYGNPDKL